MRIAAQIATQAPLTMRAGKEIVRRMREKFADVEDKDMIELCYGSADFREGLERVPRQAPAEVHGAVGGSVRLGYAAPEGRLVDP